MTRRLVFLFSLCLSSALADINQPYGKLSSTIETPHVCWAKPLREGRLKALVIAPTWGQRETVELAQRLDLAYTPLMTYSYFRVCSSGEYRQAPESLVFQDIDRKLKDSYDVIIIGKFKWDVLSQEIRYAILEKVHNGAGLIYICPQGVTEALNMVFNRDKIPNETNFICRGIPLKALPVLDRISENKLVSLSRFGKGKVAVLNYDQETIAEQDHHCLTPSQKEFQDWKVYYEYYHSLLAKLVVWATEKEPALSIKKIAPTSFQLERKQLPEAALKLELQNKGREEQIGMAFIIRDRNNRIEKEETKTVSVNPGANNFSFNFPPLGKGLHFIDILLKKDGKVIDWGSSYINVDSENQIEKIVLARDFYKNGESVRGKITLNKALPENLRLKIELWDNCQRRLAEKILEPANHEVIPFEIKINNPMSTLLKIRAAVNTADNNIVHQVEKELTVPMKQKDEFLFAISGSYPNDHITNLALGVFHNYGIDTFYYGAPNRTEKLKYNEAMNIARANLKIMPYIWRFYSKQKSGIVREPCLTAPDYLAQLKKSLKSSVRIFMLFGPVAYNLGDENFLAEAGRKPDGTMWYPDVCFSPSCQHKFRDYLKKTYGDLNSLNAEWGTSYKSWNEVKGMTFEQAKKHGNFAPWADHRTYMEEVFTGVNKLAGEIIRA
ncbi:MAG: beta-galactosidase, partial [Victivallaceae bacterium]|nr:beta-galactosidase [Victivallaceae bacterium]